MQLPTILSVLLAVGSQNALGKFTKITRQEPIDRYILDYRVFGETGCFELNQGVGTITSSELGECYDMDKWGIPIKSFNLTNIIDGCSFHIHTDNVCSDGQVDLTMGHQCGANVEDGKLWRSYKATCP